MKIAGMKKVLLILLCVVLLFTSVTLAKYAVELSVDDVEIVGERFYFRSNVLVANSDMAQLTPVTVNGKTTTVTLTNGAGALSFSDRDVSWELQYYVDAGEGFVPVLATPEAHTLVRGLTMTSETLTVSPVVYNDVEYRDVIVEARAIAPYQKTLRVRLQFEYTNHTVTYSYLKSMGVITATVTTNADSGSYGFNWLYPLVPDNADPNGILTYAKVAAKSDVDGESLSVDLEDYTTYQFHFFIAPEMREVVDEEIEGATDSEIQALILQYLTVSYE